MNENSKHSALDAYNNDRELIADQYIILHIYYPYDTDVSVVLDKNIFGNCVVMFVGIVK